MNYTDFFGMRTGVEGTGWSRLYVQSGTVTFDRPGAVMLAIVGAGGSGASGGSATGANSAPWGRKLIEIKAGDVLSWLLGAGGARPAATGNGLAGSVSTVSLNSSSIITAQGAEGGVKVASGTVSAPAPVATITGCDWWTKGIQAGDANGGSGGGAAVDLLALGLGRSPSAVAGTNLGGSVGTDVGGDLTYGGFLVEDFGLVLGTSTGAGRGSSAIATAAGLFAGGVGSGGSGVGTNGGLGGGGGAAGSTNSSSGVGGNALIYLRYLR